MLGTLLDLLSAGLPRRKLSKTQGKFFKQPPQLEEPQTHAPPRHYSRTGGSAIFGCFGRSNPTGTPLPIDVPLPRRRARPCGGTQTGSRKRGAYCDVRLTLTISCSPRTGFTQVFRSRLLAVLNPHVFRDCMDTGDTSCGRGSGKAFLRRQGSEIYSTDPLQQVRRQCSFDSPLP